jgi:outer membrane protein assembly factor BamA
MVKFISVAIFCTILFLWVSGQDTIKKIKILPVPTIGYSPETDTYIGTVALFTFNLYHDSLTRTSNAKFEFNYTWNKQLILATEWNYFFKKEKWFTKGQLQYSKFPDYYYGLGANTPKENKLLYTSNRIVFAAYLLKNAGNKFFTGANIRYLNYSDIIYNSALFYPELTDNYTFGVGYTVLRDSRDNLLTPTRGSYFNFNVGYNISRINYFSTSIDIRSYKTWGGEVTWSNRFVNETNFGNPPFYDYAFLGGDKFVRGYNYGRYRDKDLTSYQTELRLPLIWRIGIAGFGGLSNLYHGNNFDLKKTKYNFGLGLRFLVDRHDKTNLRFDYAIGQEGNNGFYISFGESF